MTRPITFDVSDDIYERIQAVARSHNSTPENVLHDTVSLLFGSVDLLDDSQVAALSDVQLWSLVHRNLAYPVDAQLSALTATSKLRLLTPAEEIQMKTLLQDYHRYVLLRSKAMFILQQRGHNVLELLADEE